MVFYIKDGHGGEIKINRGDVVTVVLDCSLLEISFEKDDKIIHGPMILPKRDIWYPAIRLSVEVAGRCEFIMDNE